MDARPRVRLFRRSPSPGSTDADDAATPRASTHDEDDQLPTPRMLPVPIADTPHPLPVHAETPAARLRALLAREQRSPRPTTTPPSSDADSAAEPARFGSSTSSVTRESLKDIFSHALREPGDTPQKRRLRRNSFDGSSMEITPVVHRDRRQRKAARRSLSDEEAEKPSTWPSHIAPACLEPRVPESHRHADPSFRLSTALTFDTLRARLVSSRSQLVDQNPPEALFDRTLSSIFSSCTPALIQSDASLASTSTSNSQHRPRASTSARVIPPVNTLTPHPSFQMSSQLAFQSSMSLG